MADTMSQTTQPTRLWRALSLAVVPVLPCTLAGSQAEPAGDNPGSVLTPQQWQAVDGSVDRALVFLSKNQCADGSFVAPNMGQPAITALCTMAFCPEATYQGRGDMASKSIGP